MADSASTPSAAAVKNQDGRCIWSKTGITGLATGVYFGFGPLRVGTMSIQLVGSFGSATFLLAGSNDGTNWKTCYMARQIATAGKHDVASFTADDAGKVLDDAYLYYRISSSGGTATAVDVTVAALRA